MYLPEHFTWTDTSEIDAFLAAHPFATVVTDSLAGLEAQHVPLLAERVDGRLALYGHVAATNALAQAHRVLAVFPGPHAFISAQWYDAADTVPTWNYQAVQVRGTLRTISDPDAVRSCFARLAGLIEGGSAAAWQSRLSASVYDRLAAAVRWFRIDATDVQAKAKLSQNHSAERRQRVIAALRAAGGDDRLAIAAAMERLR